MNETIRSAQFMGYKRPDGLVGIRNHVAVIPTVCCANEVSKKIGEQTEGTVATPHECGCEVTSQLEIPTRTLIGIGRNPNVAAVLLVSLGCETIECNHLVKEIGKSKKPVEILIIQELGGTVKTVEKGVRIAQKMVQNASRYERTSCNISDLIVATKCGGSDLTSGLAGNPAVGIASDEIVQMGGTVFIAETPELMGAEHILTKRAVNKKVAERIYEIIEHWEQRAKDEGERFHLITSGNIEGGLTTIEEKSLGAVYKAGSSQVQGVIEYAERPTGKGLFIMNTTGDDINSDTGMIGGGAQILLFTTGRGSPVGSPITPVIKITGNPHTFNKMNDNMDINAGTIIEGKESIEEVGNRLFNEILEVASGKQTKAEILGHREFAIFRERGHAY
jgi:altronate dehydratase large subunit